MFDAISGKNTQAAIDLNIKEDSHGIRHGWFIWPANFDPTWLISCEGFTAKEEAKKG
jgi:hypothetical protein